MYWVAPFGYPGVLRLFAPNPGFSQLITSFFASKSLGIHRLPFFAYLVAASLFLRMPQFLLSLYLFLFCFQYVKDRFPLGRKELIIIFIYYHVFLLSGVVENKGIEPLTSCLQGRRSSQLS